MNIAKTMSIAVVLFTALTLTHAAFVDYRSGSETKQPAQMQYLQTRKFGTETVALGSWRGDTRQKWTVSGMCCGVFDLLVRMKGGPTRIRLLRMLSEPKNKLQLANGVGIDWKAVDRHVQRLLEFSLVDVVAVAGTCKIYLITEKGRRALALLERDVNCS
jgi:hypothetical protein